MTLYIEPHTLSLLNWKGFTNSKTNPCTHLKIKDCNIAGIVRKQKLEPKCLHFHERIIISTITIVKEFKLYPLKWQTIRAITFRYVFLFLFLFSIYKPTWAFQIEKEKMYRNPIFLYIHNYQSYKNRYDIFDLYTIIRGDWDLRPQNKII